MRRFLLFWIITTAPFALLKAQFSISSRQPACNGFCNGSAWVIDSSANSYHYLWSTGDTTDTVANLCAGVYQCIISNAPGAGRDTLNVTVQQPPVLVIAPALIKNDHCYGDTSGYVQFAATGGTGVRYSFTWSTGYQGFLSDSARFYLQAGDYSITITDANACSASTSFIITQPNPITVSQQATNTTGCGICNGSVIATASGGSSSTYTYGWSNGATASAISNLCAGGYNLNVTDTTGCMVSTGINVLQNQHALTVLFSTATNIDCSQPAGFLFASPAGGTPPYNYNWSTGSNEPDIYNLPAGVYQVSVTDSLSCFAIASDTIKNLGIVITTLLQQNFVCDVNSGKIEIAVSQGSPPYELNWNSNANTDTLSGLLPGTYTVTVTDQANCSVSETYVISQVNAILSAQITGTNVTCININNGRAVVNLTGGLTPCQYLWSPGYQTTDTAVSLPAGYYRVRVTDAFGCSVFADVNIADDYNSQISTMATIGNCDSLGTATVNITAGAPPYTYLWNTQPPQTTPTAGNLTAGIYSVSVTDSTGCIRTDTVSIHYSCAGLVTGTVFYDNNANCIMDNDEQGIAGIPILLTKNNVTFEGITNLTGDYSIAVTDTGTYKIITGVSQSSAILQYNNSPCGYLEACPSNDTITFTTLKDTFQHYNFGFVGSSDFDLAINAGWDAEDANHVKQYWILYANEAFLLPYTGTATITFSYDSSLTFQSGIPAPVNDAVNHILTWTVDSLPSPAFVWRDRVQAFFTVAADLPEDYQLKSDFHIAPVDGDCDTANNSIYTEQIASLPDRPASKEVSPRGDITSVDSVLTYTVYFQNTGADTAHIIKITDSLSSYLDPASVQTIAAEPLYNQYYIGPGVVLTWVFNPANVPGSAADSLASRGFVSFTAKLKEGMPPGVYIKNRASVIIDNDTPAVTNTTSNFISFPVSAISIADNLINIRVYPNPFDNIAEVIVDGITGEYDFELIDMTGRVVRKMVSVTTNHFQLSREALGPGVYVYRVVANNKLAGLGKLVIE